MQTDRAAQIMWASLSLAACGDAAAVDTATAEACAAPASIVIGTGEYAWEDLPEGGEATMWHGPQGGWHINGSLRVEGMCEGLLVDFDVVHLATGARVCDQSYGVRRSADAQDPCAGEVIGMIGYLDITETAEVIALIGERLRVDMVVEDLCGDRAEASVEVVAVPDPGDDAP